MKNAIVCQDYIAKSALTLIERWGPAPGVPDGEDSSGKQKFRVLSPEEIADRAVAVSEAIYAALYRTGHLEDES